MKIIANTTESIAGDGTVFEFLLSGYAIGIEEADHVGYHCFHNDSSYVLDYNRRLVESLLFDDCWSLGKQLFAIRQCTETAFQILNKLPRTFIIISTKSLCAYFWWHPQHVIVFEVKEKVGKLSICSGIIKLESDNKVIRFMKLFIHI